MKIAIFSDCYLDLIGGIVSTINTEKAALEQRGHTVEIFSSAYPHSASEIKKLAKENIFPVPSCKHIGIGLTPIARRPKIIERWLLQNHPEIKDYDIYYIHYEAGCSIAGLRLARQFNIPAVQVMHGREDAGEEKLIPSGLRTIVATLLNWFHSWYLPHETKVHRDNYLANTIARAKMWTLMVNHANYADLIITPSEHFKKKLTHYGVKKPIIALHHGIKDALIETKISPRTIDENEPLRIIWHSRISGEKRPMVFLEAIKILHQDFKKTNYRVDVYGDGLDFKRAQKYAKKHHLNVIFYGAKPFNEIWQEIIKAHLDILVSYDSDTFGMTLIEAAAAGTPSLFVDKDMCEILPKDSYLMADGPAPDQIASALASYLEHPEKYVAMTKLLREYREKLKISHKIDQLEQLFTSLMVK